MSSPLRLQRGHTQWARRRSWSLSDPFPPCSGSQLHWTGQLPSTAEPYQQSPAFPWKTRRHCDWSAFSHWKTFMEKVVHFSKVQHFPENMHCGYKSKNLWLVSFQPLKNFLSKGQHFSENMQTLPALCTSQGTGEVTVPNTNLIPFHSCLEYQRNHHQNHCICWRACDKD